MSLKIIFMGTPDFAIPTLDILLKSSHTIVKVYSQRPKQSKRGMLVEKTPIHVFAEKNNLQVHTPSSLKAKEELEFLKNLRADIAIVVAYGQIIPENFLEALPHGFINIHGSILPKWRGAAPIQRAIMNGDKETGVSIMKIGKELDSGPVLLTEKVTLDDTKDYGEVGSILSKLGADLIMKSLDMIEKNTDKFMEQDHSKATYAKKITKEDELIHWNKKPSEIVRHVNALSPAPGAFINYKGEKIKIWKIKKHILTGNIGQALNDDLVIGCKEGSVEILKIQRPGKKIQDKKDFLLGFKIPKSSKLF